MKVYAEGKRIANARGNEKDVGGSLRLRSVSLEAKDLLIDRRIFKANSKSQALNPKQIRKNGPRSSIMNTKRDSGQAGMTNDACHPELGSGSPAIRNAKQYLFITYRFVMLRLDRGIHCLMGVQ